MTSMVRIHLSPPKPKTNRLYYRSFQVFFVFIKLHITYLPNARLFGFGRCPKLLTSYCQIVLANSEHKILNILKINIAIVVSIISQLTKIFILSFYSNQLTISLPKRRVACCKKEERRKAFPFSLQFALQNIICFIRATVLVGILSNFNSNQCLDKEDPKCLSFLT